jgi:carboxypeptidase T
LFLPLLLTAAPALAQDVPDGHIHPVQHLVHVDVTPRNVRRLTALDLDVAYLDLVASRAEVIVTEEQLPLLEGAGLSHRVVTRDLARFYAARLAAGGGQGPAAGSYGGWLSPPFGSGGMGGYYTLTQVGSVLDQMRSAYPNLISAKQSLGTSIQGRDIWWVRISDNPNSDEAEPELRIDALHHAREPQGMQCSLWFMLYLLESYGSDPLATYLVDNRELYFVPCVNPDGYEYNRQQAPGGGGLWRKNRRNNGGGSYGVDLNRNYPYNWGYDNSGSSSNPDSEVYRGTSAASEPEISGMVSFISGKSFNTALSLHTYSNLWLAPWGFDTQYPANWDDYDEVGSLATEVNGYTHGPASIILYEANGVTVDYDHGAHGTLAWTPEIGSSDDGFWPPQSRIVPLAEDNLLALQRTALAAGPWIRGQQLSLVDAGDGDGDFESGESVEITVLLRNSGMALASVVDLTLSSTNPYAYVTTANATAGPISSFSNGANGTPLALTIQGAQAGSVIDFQVEVDIDGWTQVLTGEIFVGSEVIVAEYDFEAGGNQGWAVGTPNDASTGTWTRVDPIGTAAQPEDDHTVAGNRCWVTGQGSSGGGVGENDVDGGRTTLLSPVWDLSGGLAPRITYWRWYSNDQGSAPNADILEIELSNNGGSSWVSAEVVGPSGAGSNGGWYEAELDVASILTPTAQVRMRVIASDLNSGSIVEAALDDVVVSYIDDNPCADPQNYCVGAPNSVGPGAAMGWLGSIDATFDDFDLLVSGTPPGNFGLFFFGPGQQQVPLGDGFLCVGGSLTRLPVVTSDPFGQAQTGLDLPGFGIQNGDTFNFQFWYRDPPGGPVGNNLSDGLEVVFCAG